MARIAVKVHPRARRTEVAGRLGEAWKLHLAAPPVEGRANEECVRFLAELAGVPRAQVRIVSGAAARLKTVEVEGIGQARLEALLAEPGAGRRAASGRNPGTGPSGVSGE